MVGEEFFDSPELQSIKKTKLVVDYFNAWAKIMAPRAKGFDPRIAYVDLFSGPGKFDDGSDSTPLIILKHAINNRVLSRQAYNNV